MSFPLNFPEPDPQYSPDAFDLEENFNVLHLSEIHAFEPEYNKDKYLERVGKQIDTYSEVYDIDRVSIVGDTGSIADVEEVFGYVDDSIEVWLIAGDEDKKDNLLEEGWKGWFEAARTSKPFDIGNDYRIFDEGYETEIRGHTVQAAHHPHHSSRDNCLSAPDPRAEKSQDIDPKTASPEELYEMKNSNGFLTNLFSVDQDSNENKEQQPLSTDADVCIYDHVHMPYARKIYDKAVIGLGGRSHNYQIKADCMPQRSLHVTSFSEDLIHALHFDSDKDAIFEHEIFDFRDDLEIFYVETPDNGIHSTSYLPLQSRFVPTQVEDVAHEDEEIQPNLWVE